MEREWGGQIPHLLVVPADATTMSDQAAIETILADLNAQQRQAVEHGEGPLLIVAGAGTGKTATLVHRVAWLIATGVPPDSILLLTFTRRAAAEMLRRVDGVLRRLREAQSRGRGEPCQCGPGCGEARFTRLPRGCCVSTASPSAFPPISRSTIGPIPKT